MNGAPGAGLLDTSLLLPPQEDLSALRATAAISVVSLGELHAGVLVAHDDVREQRRRRLVDVRELFVALPVDEEVAEGYGEVLAVARRERRMTKATDLLIIATARVHARILHTADDRQARLARASGVPVAGG